MEKRKARKKLAKTVDIVKPFTLDMLGTTDDPCFGKLYSPAAPECQMCGDNEICAIVLGQLNNVTRSNIEKEGKFKDIEESQIPPLDKDEIKKKIKTRIRELIKFAGKKGIQRDKVISDIHATYVTQGFSKAKIGKILDRLTDVTDRYTYTAKNTLYIWKAV